ncbi:MAG: hypothetical protein H0U55_17230 [Rubrobacteraceae bacterium]|nr:hypothetical protein [Rubrobacteraceae bacterium]
MMLKIWEADNFRRTLAGLCLIAAPLAMLASEVSLHLTTPDNPLDTGQQLTIIAENPGIWQLAVLLSLLAAILFVPAVLGMIHLLRGRGVVLGHIGGGLALIGALGLAGHAALLSAFGEISKAGTALGLDPGLMVKITERMEESIIGAIIVLLMWLLGLFFGLILLSIGLYRARFVPIWVVACPVLAFVSAFLPFTSDVQKFVSVGFLVVGLGAIGLKVLALSDQEWEKGPQPLPGKVEVGAQSQVQ